MKRVSESDQFVLIYSMGVLVLVLAIVPIL